MPAPFEVILAPFTLYLADVGTVFPLIDAVPAAAWAKVGTSGDLNYMRDGVTVEHREAEAVWRALGSGGPRKAWTEEEDLLIRLVLADLSLEQYALALNHNAVTDTAPGAGAAGFRKIGLSRGLTKVRKALLLRGLSPYGDNWNAQYEVPIAVQNGSPSVVFRASGEPAGLALQWRALIDPSASAVERFGRLIAQDADPV